MKKNITKFKKNEIKFKKNETKRTLLINKKTGESLRKKKLTERPYTFIKWKDRKTVQKFLRKGQLTVNKKKLEELLKKLSTLKDVDLLIKSLVKNVDLPIERPGKRQELIIKNQTLVLPISSLYQNVELLIKGLKRYNNFKFLITRKLLKRIIEKQEKNLVLSISSLEKKLELPIKGKKLELPIKGKKLVLPIIKFVDLIIERQEKNLVLSIKEKYESSSVKAVKRKTQDKILEIPIKWPELLKSINKRKNEKKVLLTTSKIANFINLTIKRQERLIKLRIVAMYRNIVLWRLQKSPFFEFLEKEEKFIFSFIFYLVFSKILETQQIQNLKNKFFLKEIKWNLLQESNQYSFKELFLEDFFSIDNSYLILLKNKFLVKKKINNYLFFKFCYFLKIHLFSSLIKGEISLSNNILLKLKPLFKFSPFFFNDNKFLKPVKKEKKRKSKNIIFLYRYNYSLSKACNYLRCIYFKKRWEEKIETDKTQSFILKNYGSSKGLVSLTNP